MKCDRNSPLFPKLSSLSALTIGLCLSVAPQDTLAQLTPDQTLGPESSRVERQPQPTPTNLITGGARRGQNLFHSFQDFNVESGQSVFFRNPNGVNNILTRVTGGSTSNIDSVLGVRGDANLFVINPNGIIFGPDASLDVGGSFVATTADALQFNEQDSFSATSPQTSSLLSIQPSAFFFNQINSGEITNQSQAFFDFASGLTGGISTAGLGVPEGKSLLLVGGNINIDGGGLNAISGRVELASVQAGQTLEIDEADGELSLQSLSPAQARNITFDNAGITTTGARGLIRFQGNNLILTDSTISTFIPTTSSSVEGVNTGIVLMAQDLVLDDTSITTALFSSPEQVGDILIEADQFIARNNSSLSAGTSTSGNEGNIIIKVKDLFSLDSSSLSTESTNVILDAGESGDIEIDAEEFTSLNNAEISTSTIGIGNAGDILIEARNRVLLDNSQIRSESNPSPSDPFSEIGEAGEIQIKSAQFTAQNNSQLSTSTSTTGNSGNIIIKVDDFSLISNSRIRNNIRSSASGDGGNINIDAGQFTVQDDSVISTNLNGQSSAGSINIKADNLSLINDGRIRSDINSLGRGDGGDINIESDQFTAQNDSVISTNLFGQGKTGNINIKADDFSLASNSRIRSDVNASAIGNGGNINIDIDRFSAQNDSFLFTILFGQGTSGDINVRADDFSLVSNSRIRSDINSSAEGDGGDINIEAEQFSADQNSSLTSNLFGQGKAGNISIKASAFDLNDESSLRSDVVDFARGDGGDINVVAEQFSAQDARISTILFDFGEGNTGNIDVTAKDLMLTNTDISSDTRPSSKGDAGNIQIKAEKLISQNSKFLTTTSSRGNAGGLTFNVSDKFLLVDSSILSDNFQTLEDDGRTIFVDFVGSGDAGNIEISARQLISRNSLSSSTTLSQGNAGNITFNIDDLLQINNSRIFSAVGFEDATGGAGNVEINAGQLISQNGSGFSTSTSGQGDAGDLTFDIGGQLLLNNSSVLSESGPRATGRGGNINIQTQELQVTNGAVVSAANFGNGAGGNLSVSASKGIELRGTDSQLSVASDAMASGNAGSLNVETQDLAIAGGAQITVSSLQAQAGTLTINANSLELNQGTLSAETGESGQEGANINLQISQILTLRNESLISADAFGEANGGNILINALLLLALSPEGPNGSDIIANAIDGQGGNISITTQGRFGIEPRDSLTPLNDITASSSTNLPGEIFIQTSEVDPSDNIISLPIRPPEVKVVKSCSARQGRSDFVVTGRGGLPPTAQESLGQDAFQVGLVTLDPSTEPNVKNHNVLPQKTQSPPSKSSVQQINEAQGWRKNAKGKLMLIAETPSASVSPQPSCQG
ncbi:hypothetical protein C1752_08852 [Acaryochloris thomasi RCC1774]|uniref:Filamentous haemagglutinin FhaB/tRNA nuclease CdiA-like TPS domain-containing protein n=1 Tax=Acaryochloris thomasi RCC1774 TaxID=1764569 RepID=A0A2W1JA19_9CYAN|nr:filamentous hemagglutinin N-terminal domain-containing protein [Acaryochloris thomasi]PZD70858.1 hypothetical protein C1752_08852 [Acaryochloris thomasi RCC1774]